MLLLLLLLLLLTLLVMLMLMLIFDVTYVCRLLIVIDAMSRAPFF